MKPIWQAQYIIVGLQAATLHSTYIKSAITELCTTYDHTKFKPVTTACSPHAYAEF